MCFKHFKVNSVKKHFNLALKFKKKKGNKIVDLQVFIFKGHGITEPKTKRNYLLYTHKNRCHRWLKSCIRNLNPPIHPWEKQSCLKSNFALACDRARPIVLEWECDVFYLALDLLGLRLSLLSRVCLNANVFSLQWTESLSSTKVHILPCKFGWKITQRQSFLRTLYLCGGDGSSVNTYFLKTMINTKLSAQFQSTVGTI